MWVKGSEKHAFNRDDDDNDDGVYPEGSVKCCHQTQQKECLQCEVKHYLLCLSQGRGRRSWAACSCFNFIKNARFTGATARPQTATGTTGIGRLMLMSNAIPENHLGNICTIMQRQNTIKSPCSTTTLNIIASKRNPYIWWGSSTIHLICKSLCKRCGGQVLQRGLFILFGAINKRAAKGAGMQLPTYGTGPGFCSCKKLAARTLRQWSQDRSCIHW